jgi:hypothetical protein
MARSAMIKRLLRGSLMQDCNALQAAVAKPTDKQHLPPSACFDWLVTGGVLTVNPAHAVRGPKHVVKRGKILTADQARLLDRIDTQRPMCKIRLASLKIQQSRRKRSLVHCRPQHLESAPG